MPTGFGLASSILLVFYLYLLARWERVKRPMLYLLGAAGLAFGMAGGFFLVSGSTITVARVFGVIGTLVAFAGVVGACFGGELPVKLPGDLGKTNTAPPQM